MVYDQSVRLPGCAWTDAHSAQGFARRESVVNFNTVLEFGCADVSISRGAYQPRGEHDRVIAVPFLVTSGAKRRSGCRQCFESADALARNGRHRRRRLKNKKPAAILKSRTRSPRFSFDGPLCGEELTQPFQGCGTPGIANPGSFRLLKLPMNGEQSGKGLPQSKTLSRRIARQSWVSFV
jgi:hypothetical protein